MSNEPKKLIDGIDHSEQSPNSSNSTTTTTSLRTLANKILSDTQSRTFNTANDNPTDDLSHIGLNEKLRSNLYVTSNITMKELQEFLGDDWDDYKNNLEALIAWVDLIMTGRLIEQGKIPPHYTAVTHCIHCGDVPVPPSQTNGGKVLGCMWCWNRMKNLPIPKVNISQENKEVKHD